MAVNEWSRAIAIVAFVASYIGLGLGRVPGLRIDRTGAAIIGATVMVVSGALPWADAVAAVASASSSRPCARGLSPCSSAGSCWDG